MGKRTCLSYISPDIHLTMESYQTQNKNPCHSQKYYSETAVVQPYQTWRFLAHMQTLTFWCFHRITEWLWLGDGKGSLDVTWYNTQSRVPRTTSRPSDDLQAGEPTASLGNLCLHLVKNPLGRSFCITGTIRGYLGQAAFGAEILQMLLAGGCCCQ